MRVIRTPRQHFEELDWFDLARGDCEPGLRIELERHRAECDECARRFSSIVRMSLALPHAGEFPAFGPEIRDASEDRRRAPADASAVARARAEVERRAREEGRAREELERWLPVEAHGVPPAGAPVRISHLLEADDLVRGLFRTDADRANQILEWAISALPDARSREPEDPRGDLAEGKLLMLKGYSLTIPGRGREALEFLDRARPMLTAGDSAEIDLSLWHRDRAIALRLLSRHDEALAELDQAERLLRLLGDENRLARCRISRAVSTAEMGDLAHAVEIYEELLAGGTIFEDRALLGFVYQNLGADLVDLRKFDRARAAIARAIDLFRATGQDDPLLGSRASLARLAILETRYAEALRICVALRSDLRARGLLRNEVENELRFAEIHLETGRAELAAAVCRDLIPRITEMEFGAEAVRAARYLARAESELDVSHVREVQRFLRRLDSDPNAAWSAA